MAQVNFSPAMVGRRKIQSCVVGAAGVLGRGRIRLRIARMLTLAQPGIGSGHEANHRHHGNNRNRSDQNISFRHVPIPRSPPRGHSMLK
jgi:hypothetical protein